MVQLAEILTDGTQVEIPIEFSNMTEAATWAVEHQLSDYVFRNIPSRSPAQEMKEIISDAILNGFEKDVEEARIVFQRAYQNYMDAYRDYNEATSKLYNFKSKQQ